MLDLLWGMVLGVGVGLTIGWSTTSVDKPDRTPDLPVPDDWREIWYPENGRWFEGYKSAPLDYTRTYWWISVKNGGAYPDRRTLCGDGFVRVAASDLRKKISDFPPREAPPALSVAELEEELWPAQVQTWWEWSGRTRPEDAR